MVHVPFVRWSLAFFGVMFSVIALAAVLFLTTPCIADAAGLVPCGGEGEQPCQACHVTRLVSGVVNWLVLILTTVAAILFAWAGIKLVISGGNPGALKEAKSMFTNVAIGYIIVLAGWLLIDTLLKWLVTDQAYGTWNDIQCVEQPPVYAVYNAADLQRAYGTTSPATAREPYAAGDCSPENLMRVGMTQQQANTFSCIARAESNCNNNAQNPSSSARGVFQITRGWNTRCHNLNLPQCSSAVGSDGALNCSEAFRGGRPRPGYEQQAELCNRAASNFDCNAAAALCLYNGRGGYGDWLGNPGTNHHTAQRACVARYAQ